MRVQAIDEELFPPDGIQELKQKILFSLLYFSEGAPIGFLWFALPTQLRIANVSIEQITWLASVLVLPWTFKFLWAPLVDMIQGDRWNFRHWIWSTQLLMGLTLLPLFWLDLATQYSTLSVFLLLHAVCAATQDVAIDGYCVSVTQPGQRGQYNAWMQMGMMSGRAAMGGGALLISQFIGLRAVVVLLIVCTTFSGIFLKFHARNSLPATDDQQRKRNISTTALRFLEIFRERNTWIGLAFAGLGGAAFKSLEVFYGPYLIDRGIAEHTIGWFTMLPFTGSMIAGTIVGGWLADRLGSIRIAAISLTILACLVIALGFLDWQTRGIAFNGTLAILAVIAVFIGVFTSSSYALFMDISRKDLGASQFSTFMGATNGCESWSVNLSGRIIETHGYPMAMGWMGFFSLLSLPLLYFLPGKRPIESQSHGGQPIAEKPVPVE